MEVLPNSQFFATSCEANESGRNTERMPCVNHLSGKSAAKCCIQPGNWLNTKNTPLKNCKIITIGETTADAPRPLFGTTENAIPSTVEQALPNKINQVKVNHLLACVGRFNPKNAAPAPSNNAVCKIIKTITK